MPACQFRLKIHNHHQADKQERLNYELIQPEYNQDPPYSIWWHEVLSIILWRSQETLLLLWPLILSFKTADLPRARTEKHERTVRRWRLYLEWWTCGRARRRGWSEGRQTYFFLAHTPVTDWNLALELPASNFWWRKRLDSLSRRTEKCCLLHGQRKTSLSVSSLTCKMMNSSWDWLPQISNAPHNFIRSLFR